MLSIANKVFRDFKEFYSEINAATLTGAIDVIVVEQPDGTYLCSPFHVRFGKLGVLRSREKIVDIEINGEPVDIHMKLGESGEAFFVEECSEDDLEVLPHHMATSPIPSSELTNFEDSITVNQNDIKIPLPRRNSVDLGSKEPSEAESSKFENQTSDYSKRRHTDNDLVRRDLSSTKLEFTTQKLRQEFPEEQDQLYDEIKEKFNLRRQSESHQFRPITEDGFNDSDKSTGAPEAEVEVPKSDQKEKSDDKSLVKDDNKSATSQQSKKKRRKKSMIKKKSTQRKNSSSSSAGSINSDAVENSGASQDTSPNTENDITKELPRDDDVVMQEVRRDLEVHFFSDGELGSAMSPQQSRPSTPIQSDTEFEVSQREKSENAMTSSASWKWGEPVVTTSDDHPDNANASESNKRNSMLSGMLSFMKQKRKNVPDGLYLSDLDPETMDPEVAALYFPESSDKPERKESKREDDRESGNGTSLPQSPTASMELIKSDSDYDDKQQADTSLNFVSLSVCGGIEKGGPTDEEFDANIVQYTDICQNPALFASPNLVVRLNNKYYSWSAACPVVMTLLAYQKPLPVDVCEKLLMTDQQIKSTDLDKSKDEEQPQAAESRKSWFSWRRSGGGSVQVEPKKSSLQLEKADSVDGVATQTSPLTSPYKTAVEAIKENELVNGSLSSEDSYKNNKDLTDLGLATEKFRKTLRLSSNQIELLNLKNGMNEVEFSVTTAYQGTSRCKCYLFKWKHNDKVVISDIDGTITKSDVLGHILPMVGKDWAQIGVAQLFSKIEENGYKMLYLSARAIGQSRATREYLRSIRQGDVQLPDGPLLLNPTSLISAFHREVIERKPEQFKIECLSDIKSLFSDKNPFYAGYGNRINDVWAYRAVGIPIMRIYTINPRGELKHELTQTFQSTYEQQSLAVNDIFPALPKDPMPESSVLIKFNSMHEKNEDDDSCFTDDDGLQFGEIEYRSMTYIVDQMFPPIKLSDADDCIEYTWFNYWRDPVGEIDLDESGSSTPSNDNTNASLQAIQSKPLTTIPEY